LAASLFSDHRSRTANLERVPAVELDTAHTLAGVVGNDLLRLLVAIEQGAGGHHLGHVQARGRRTIGELGEPFHRQPGRTCLTAQPPERCVRHARHGGEHHGGADGDRSDLQSTHLPIVAAALPPRGSSRPAHQCPGCPIPRRCGCGRQNRHLATTTTPSRYGTSGQSSAAAFCSAAADSCGASTPRSGLSAGPCVAALLVTLPSEFLSISGKVGQRASSALRVACVTRMVALFHAAATAMNSSNTIVTTSAGTRTGPNLSMVCSPLP